MKNFCGLLKVFSVMLATLLYCPHSIAINITLKQVLIDGKNSVDGLDNPRQIKVSPDGKFAFVASADDNSMLVLEMGESLKPINVFKNAENRNFKLEGATGLVTLNKGQHIAVASFYDSAISVFSNNGRSGFSFTESHNDDISYQRVFKSNESLEEKDTYGLFGAWDILSTGDEEQVFVASYKSNALSIFDVDNHAQLTFNRKIASATPNSENLGNPVSLSFSEVNNELIVAGFEGNKLSILSREENGDLLFKQTIENNRDGVKDLINPQKVIHSTNGKYIYVACTGSNAIVVFERKNNKYEYLQSVTHNAAQGLGLTGVASLALAADDAQLFAAGEFDSGLHVFNVSDAGKLAFKQTVQFTDHKVEGVTSIATTSDGKHILMTLGKLDSLYVLALNESKTNN